MGEASLKVGSQIVHDASFRLWEDAHSTPSLVTLRFVTATNQLQGGRFALILSYFTRTRFVLAEQLIRE
jgi:hypothetical protein